MKLSLKKKLKLKHKKRIKKKTLSKNECTVGKQEWAYPVCKWTWKQIQFDWIICRMCTVSTHKDCRVNEFYFYVNNYTPSI